MGDILLIQLLLFIFSGLGLYLLLPWLGDKNPQQSSSGDPYSLAFLILLGIGWWLLYQRGVKMQLKKEVLQKMEKLPKSRIEKLEDLFTEDTSSFNQKLTHFSETRIELMAHLCSKLLEKNRKEEGVQILKQARDLAKSEGLRDLESKINQDLVNLENPKQ